MFLWRFIRFEKEMYPFYFSKNKRALLVTQGHKTECKKTFERFATSAGVSGFEWCVRLLYSLLFSCDTIPDSPFSITDVVLYQAFIQTNTPFKNQSEWKACKVIVAAPCC